MQKTKKIYFSIGGVVIAGILFLLLMDNVIMPAYTNYNEGVTVPNVSQISLEDAKQELTDRGLRYELAERRSNEAYPADYVIDQTPAASKIVKPDRKVYLTVNSEANPTVKVPEVVDMSLRNARIQLQNAGLSLGTISYESSRFKNSVLRQSVPPQTVVPKGTSIDLAVSDGLGEKLVAIPEIKGLRLAEAQQKLREKGLRVGEIEYQPSKEVSPNIILDYSPRDDQLIEGERLKLIVSERYGNQEETESGAVVDTTGARN
ncbi:PASTA domain-containing protein [Fodinibius sediminis]|uniref:PASTA domain, binds beta-lactams n=1 Tax=Fodinibius sediminis TaxID=1214077 RepID=A0A521DSB9_9BACT|nr:PASTA domain-containing protein [Fodinibius sediminis]SMO74518.1 PASTA domain, binds beta-lactams [Fodinibius sediminis]